MFNFRAFSFLVLLTGLSGYSYWFYSQDYEWLIPHMSDRAPAAIKQSSVLKDILEKPMRVFKRDVVAKSIKIRKNNHFTYFSIGHFSVDSKKGKNLICLEYPYIRLKFHATGISIGGAKPTAWVSASCGINKNSDYISNIPLPFDQLGRWSAEDQSTEYAPKGNQTVVKFESILGDWPELWSLEQVEFMHSPVENTGSVIISKKELLRALGKKILISK